MAKSFLKMHGLGNDFIIIDGRVDGFTATADFCRLIADRRLGVGCDQLVILEPPRDENAAIYMSMFNADGSMVRACGNMTRCVAKLMFDEKNLDEVTLETVSGLLHAHRQADGSVAVDCGPPRLDWEQIPLAGPADTLHPGFDMHGMGEPSYANMGNPHAVFFVSDVAAVDLATVGPILERDPMFPDRANIEFAQPLSRDRIRMRVWERGAGITPACGSGACAVLVSAVRRGISERKATIVLDGGELTIEWRDDDHIWMTGPATLVFRGELSESLSI